MRRTDVFRRVLRRGRGVFRGFGLVEVVLAILILSMLVTGALGYSYHSAREVSRAERHETACRLAALVLEGWKGSPDPASYNPVAQLSEEIEITALPFFFGFWGGLPGAFTLDCYKVEMPQTDYYLLLSRRMGVDATPETLHVYVSWQRDRQQVNWWEWEHYCLTTYTMN